MPGEAPLINRRAGDRRSPGRRELDHRALQRAIRGARLDDPVAIALWELEQERHARVEAERVERLRAVALGFTP